MIMNLSTQETGMSFHLFQFSSLSRVIKIDGPFSVGTQSTREDKE